MEITTKGAGMTDGMGFTELDWETTWNSETATSTVHRASFDNDEFCDECDPFGESGRCSCGAAR
jgi:hypothetical protein